MATQAERITVLEKQVKQLFAMVKPKPVKVTVKCYRCQAKEQTTLAKARKFHQPCPQKA